MLKLMLALLGMLALSVTASTVSVAPFAPFTNFTIIYHDDDNPSPITTHSFVDIAPWFQQCRPPYAQDPGDRCFCWGPSKYYAVDRALMTSSIDWACTLLTGGVGEPAKFYGMADGLQHGLTIHGDYEPTEGNEEGRIALSIFTDIENPACVDPFLVSQDWCRNALRSPLDNCDTAGENHKNGGFMLDGCVWWVLDPAPYVHEKYYYGPFDGRPSPPTDYVPSVNDLEGDQSDPSVTLNPVDTKEDIAEPVPPTPSTEVRSFRSVDTNTSSIPLMRRTFMPCNHPGNWDFQDKCYCFWEDNDKKAVDRKWITAAIDAACGEYFTGGIGNPVSVYGWGDGLKQYYNYHHLYTPTKDTEEGEIFIGLHIDNTDPDCVGPRSLGWEECHYLFRYPLDDCDTDAENGKHGGMILEKCFWWIVDPAPKSNQPYPFNIYEADIPPQE